MRLLNLYQLYDLKAEKVTGPIMSESKDAVAIRTFHNILRDKRTEPGQYPEDFQLLYLGYQDEESGIIGTVKTPTVITTGLGWVTDERERAAEEQRHARSGENTDQPVRIER